MWILRGVRFLVVVLLVCGAAACVQARATRLLARVRISVSSGVDMQDTRQKYCERM